MTDKEFDRMMKEEIESGNPFAGYSSYRSYKASNRKEKTPEQKKAAKELKDQKIESNKEDHDELPF